MSRCRTPVPGRCSLVCTTSPVAWSMTQTYAPGEHRASGFLWSSGRPHPPGPAGPGLPILLLPFRWVLRIPPPGSRAVSSVGRAPALHAGCRRFEPVTAHGTGTTPSVHPSGEMLCRAPCQAVGSCWSAGRARVPWSLLTLRIQPRPITIMARLISCAMVSPIATESLVRRNSTKKRAVPAQIR